MHKLSYICSLTHTGFKSHTAHKVAQLVYISSSNDITSHCFVSEWVWQWTRPPAVFSKWLRIMLASYLPSYSYTFECICIIFRKIYSCSVYPFLTVWRVYFQSTNTFFNNKIEPWMNSDPAFPLRVRKILPKAYLAVLKNSPDVMISQKVKPCTTDINVLG